MLTKSEVIQKTGLGKTFVQMAIARGDLPAHKEPLPPGRGKGIGYMIDEDDLDAWLASIDRPQYTVWSDADLAALVELSGTCSDAQIAEYLGRTQRSVSQRLFKLRAVDGVGLRPRRGSVARLPWVVPGELPLLARTCIACGNLRDASYFARQANAGRRKAGHCWMTACYLCLRERAAARRKPRNRRMDKKLQEASLPSARNHRQPYTSADYEVLADRGKSDLAVGVELGRTFIAVRHRRQAMGFYDGPKRKELPDSRWSIDFPNALVALQEHYRELGVVPESEWEWNDDDVA